jgi:hypothetical protein
LQLSAYKSGATAPTQYVSNVLSLSTRNWYHLAVTYDLGQVGFFLNGTASGRVGTVGDPLVAESYLKTSSAALLIGRTSNTASPYSYNGRMDELRMSQVVRWTTNFTRPTTPYTSD